MPVAREMGAVGRSGWGREGEALPADEGRQGAARGELAFGVAVYARDEHPSTRAAPIPLGSGRRGVISGGEKRGIN